MLSLKQVGEELCIYYGPDDQLWFDYPPDPNDSKEAGEDEEDNDGSDPEDIGDGGELGIESNLAALESSLSPEAFAALQSHMGSK